MTGPLQTRLIHPANPDDTWWRHAVIYQVYPRSWSDGDGDGVGDIPGITARLPYLARLGVDAIWFSPWYRSPMADAGYDVADYCDIDPVFGTLQDADELVAQAHAQGLKIIVDLVPNHSSDEHPWFQAALAAGPGSPERDRYLFRDGLGPDGSQPPNDWRSVFGGTAWTRVTDGQWYLHLFDPKQPDFNWQNPQVHELFHAILRFWLDRGIDGFRVDVAHGLVKEAGLPDWGHEHAIAADHVAQGGDRPPMWDQDGVHEIYRDWRKLLDSYGRPDRIICAEAWVKPQARVARYVRADEFHQAFNFDFLDTPWNAEVLREVIEDSLTSADSVGAPSTWVLSNHDVVRHASRLGLPQDGTRPNGIATGDPQPDRELGLRRARAATALMLALPGGAYLYQGEELGLPEASTLPDEARQDPTFARTHGLEVGRDGCRVPMPWEKDATSFGFGPGEHPWLPQPEIYGEYAVDQQDGVPASTLELYRALLAQRRALGLGTGSLAVVEGYGPAVVALENSAADQSGRTLVLANLGQDAAQVPEGAEVLVSSEPIDGHSVPTDVTVWARL